MAVGILPSPNSFQYRISAQRRPAQYCCVTFVNYYYNVMIDKNESESLRCRLQLVAGCTVIPSCRLASYNSARDGSTTTAGRRPVTVHFRGTKFETLRATDGNQPWVFVCVGHTNFILPHALLRCVVVASIPTIGSSWRSVRTTNWPGWNPSPARISITNGPLSRVPQHQRLLANPSMVPQRRRRRRLLQSGWVFGTFSRKPVPPTSTLLQSMNAIASKLKLDTSVLEVVNHTGCDYGTERRCDLFSGFLLSFWIDSNLSKSQKPAFVPVLDKENNLKCALSSNVVLESMALKMQDDRSLKVIAL
jgi:hypothetical protein